MENICHFIPYNKEPHSIQTINFVLENNHQPFTSLKSEATYKMHYVVSGKGFLHTFGKIQTLSKGDIFFTFPASPFCIESDKNFSYMYISFVGPRGNMLMDKLKISSQNCIFSGYTELQNLWKNGLDTAPEFIDVVSESILLYTFSTISKRVLPEKHPEKSGDLTSLKIKKYIDDHFTDSDFSLEAVGKEISYNKKYISSVFKKYFGVSITQYLNTVRIQHACTLVQQGMTSISDIASLCGYTDPQYFSRVFKNKIGMSPGEYIKTDR